VRLEELGQLKNPMISYGIDTATVQLVVYCSLVTEILVVSAQAVW
jgi:hypothetical protein